MSETNEVKYPPYVCDDCGFSNHEVVITHQCVLPGWKGKHGGQAFKLYLRARHMEGGEGSLTRMRWASVINLIGKEAAEKAWSSYEEWATSV